MIEKSNKIEIEDFLKIDMRIGKIISVKNNEKAHKPAYVIQIDFGENIGVKQSSAQITNYEAESLVGKNVICVINLNPKKIAGYKSEVLVLGVNDEGGGISLLTPDYSVPLGNKIY